MIDLSFRLKVDLSKLVKLLLPIFLIYSR